MNKVAASRPTPKPGTVGNRGDTGKVDELSSQVIIFSFRKYLNILKILENQLILNLMF